MLRVLIVAMMKRGTLQASSLKHSIKKGVFSVLGKLDLSQTGAAEVPPLLPLATHLTNSIAEHILERRGRQYE